MILALNGLNDDINQFKVRTHRLYIMCCWNFYGKEIENFIDNIQDGEKGGTVVVQHRFVVVTYTNTKFLCVFFFAHLFYEGYDA